MTIESRATGWLNARTHSQVREILLHTIFRFRLICPIYCAMPDHMHLIWMGTASHSDQLLASRFFKAQSNHVLSPFRWQSEAHDHVLRDYELERDAFSAICEYVRRNPLRAGLLAKGAKYPYVGAAIPGYPSLQVDAANYWEMFWKVHQKLVEE